MSVKIVETGWLNSDWTDKSFFHSQAHKLLSFREKTNDSSLSWLLVFYYLTCLKSETTKVLASCKTTKEKCKLILINLTCPQKGPAQFQLMLPAYLVYLSSIT